MPTEKFDRQTEKLIREGIGPIVPARRWWLSIEMTPVRPGLTKRGSIMPPALFVSLSADITLKFFALEGTLHHREDQMTSQGWKPLKIHINADLTTNLWMLRAPSTAKLSKFLLAAKYGYPLGFFHRLQRPDGDDHWPNCWESGKRGRRLSVVYRTSNQAFGPRRNSSPVKRASKQAELSPVIG